MAGYSPPSGTPGTPPKRRLGWEGIGVLVAAGGVLVSLGAWLHPYAPADPTAGEPAGVQQSTAVKPEGATTTAPPSLSYMVEVTVNGSKVTEGSTATYKGPNMILKVRLTESGSAHAVACLYNLAIVPTGDLRTFGTGSYLPAPALPTGRCGIDETLKLDGAFRGDTLSLKIHPDDSGGSIGFRILLQDSRTAMDVINGIR